MNICLLYLASGQVEMPTPLSGGVIPATALPQGAQMTMQARRLYCGNLPFGITEVIYFTNIDTNKVLFFCFLWINDSSKTLVPIGDCFTFPLM